MKKVFIILLLSAFCYTSHAQPERKIEYLNEYSEVISDSSTAMYYRTVEQNQAKYIVKQYYKTGQIKMEAVCSAISPSLIKDGKVIVYYADGRVESEGTYKVGVEHGTFVTFYESGIKKSEVVYENGKRVSSQYWRADGSENTFNKVVKSDVQLTGIAPKFDPIIEDGDTSSVKVDVMPQYPKGDSQLQRDLSSVMTYPRSARKLGIEGTVYVQFVIDKKGNISDVRVIRGIHPDCDVEAVNAVKSLKQWIPGTRNGRPVNVRYVLPIMFSLTDKPKKEK